MDYRTSYILIVLKSLYLIEIVPIAVVFIFNHVQVGGRQMVFLPPAHLKCEAKAISSAG
jgi:hypothetical protein